MERARSVGDRAKTLAWLVVLSPEFRIRGAPCSGARCLSLLMIFVSNPAAVAHYGLASDSGIPAHFYFVGSH
jgi:hypothetical protein